MPKMSAATFRLPVWIQTGLKQLAFYKNTTMQALVAEAVAGLLESEGIKPPDNEWGNTIKANMELLKKTGISPNRLEELAKGDDLPSQEEKHLIDLILDKRPKKK